MYISWLFLQKGYRCYCPSLHRYLVFADVTFLENVPFSSPPTHMSQGEEDNLLVYSLTSPIVSSEHAPVPGQVQPPITQVYLRRQTLQPRVSHHLLCHQIQSTVMISLLLFVKVKSNVPIQFLPFSLITICLLIPILLLHPWTLLRCLTIS